MLSNAFSVLSDNSATGAQKLGAMMSVLMGFGTAIPAVIGLLENMGKTVTLVGTEISLAMWQVTLIVAAVAALGAIAFAYKEIEDTDEKRLNRLTDSSRELNDSYKEAINRAKDLKSAFDNYDNVYDSLNNCIKYTDEWYEALDNVRNTVLDLLTEFPELANFANLLEWDDEL
jgi:hypothetical protein